MGTSYNHKENMYVFVASFINPFPVPFIIFVYFLFSLALVFILIVLFFGLYLHAVVLVVGGKCGVKQTLKASMLGSVPMLLLGWIPVIWIIRDLWSFGLIVFGIQELHKLDPKNNRMWLFIVATLFLYYVLRNIDPSMNAPNKITGAI